MAYKLMTPQGGKDLPFVWNVSSHVGCAKTCANRHTDVELCQFFFRELATHGYIVETLTGTALRPMVQVTGTFDPVLGFWIYLQQDAPGVVSDGIVSPAKGIAYGSAMWLITWLNYQYRKAFPEAYQTLDKDVRLSPALRAELAKTWP
jgi:hypothetical protein